MKQDEIIEMARQASSQERLPWNGTYIFNSKKQLIEFAKLVAVKEREACAKVCEWYSVSKRANINYSEECAQAIRARGEA